jgi:hypothetical protein
MKKILLLLVLAGCTRADSKACLTTLPTRAKLLSLSEPEKMSYLDSDGQAKVGMRITVDVDSAAAFFNYIENLEEIAKKALGCRTR